MGTTGHKCYIYFNVLLLFTVKHMSVHSIPLMYKFVKAVKKGGAYVALLHGIGFLSHT